MKISGGIICHRLTRFAFIKRTMYDNSTVYPGIPQVKGKIKNKNGTAFLYGRAKTINAIIPATSGPEK
jgi:hypothetical protein